MKNRFLSRHCHSYFTSGAQELANSIALCDWVKCDKTQKLKMWQLKKSKWDKTKNSKRFVVTEQTFSVQHKKNWQLKNSNCDKIQNLKLIQILNYWKLNFWREKKTFKIVFLLRTTSHVDNRWDILRAPIFNLAMFLYTSEKLILHFLLKL